MVADDPPGSSKVTKYLWPNFANLSWVSSTMFDLQDKLGGMNDTLLKLTCYDEEAFSRWDYHFVDRL